CSAAARWHSSTCGPSGPSRNSTTEAAGRAGLADTVTKAASSRVSSVHYRASSRSFMRATFAEYRSRYRHVAMERVDGILTLRLHSDDGPLVWGARPHEELGYCFGDVGNDPENRVVILTGTGDRFIGGLDDSWVG